jgi:hypothetical protein
MNAPRLGNSRFEWTPRLALADVDAEAPDWSPLSSASSHVQRSADGVIASGLSGGNKAALVVFDVASPWVLCGGNVTARFATAERSASPAGCGIEFSVDLSTWATVWSGPCAGHVAAVFDAHIQGFQAPELGVYNYSLRLALPAGVHRRERCCHSARHIPPSTLYHYRDSLVL